MGQSVDISDELVDDARSVAPFMQRSIAGQIEFWASLGKSIEPLLHGDRALLLQRSSAERPLSELLAEVDSSKGRKRVEAVLGQQPYPHYKAVAGRSDLVRRIKADGSETVGRFVGRIFEPVEDEN